MPNQVISHCPEGTSAKMERSHYKRSLVPAHMTPNTLASQLFIYFLRFATSQLAKTEQFMFLKKVFLLK